MNNPSSPPLTPISDALDKLLSGLPRIEKTEEVELLSASGRVLAEDFIAQLDVPPHDNSAMDGYAIRVVDQGESQAEKPAELKPRFKVAQRIAAGEIGKPLNAGEAARIFTGAPLPEGADAVVMQENCEADEEFVTVLQQVSIGENLRLAGEDIRRGKVLLPAGHRLLPQDIGLLASSGITHVTVRQRPLVALMTTGDELGRPGTELGPGQIYNSNFYSLASLLQNLEVEVIDVGVVADDLQGTTEALQRAATSADCIISTGGVSVGEEDHVRAAVESLGQLDLWKLAIKPGKPFAYGRIRDCQFFGLPGNPVSAFVTFVLLVRPCLLALQGCERVMPRQLSLLADFESAASGVRQEYLRVSLVPKQDGTTRVRPFNNQSSGVGSSLSSADGLVIIPPYTSVSPGDFLNFIPFSELIF